MARPDRDDLGVLFQDIWASRAFRSRERALARAVRLRCRLGPTSARLLFLVAAAGPEGVGVVQLAAAVGLYPSGASRAAAPLVRRGLVERWVSAADRRLRPLGLSAEGAEMVRALVLAPPVLPGSGSRTGGGFPSAAAGAGRSAEPSPGG